MMTGTSGAATPGEKGKHPTFHHVWRPEMKYGFFESNGVKMVYNIEGRGEETIIVAPGGPGLPQEYVHPMLSNLSHYANLVYFDRRVDIISSRNPHEVISPSEIAEDIDALRQTLGLNRITLLGHSFGGAVALTYALRYPQHVKRLLLLSTSAVIENPLETEQRVMKMLSPAELSAMSSNEPGMSPCDLVKKRYRALYPYYFHQKPNSQWLEAGTYAIYFDALAKKLVLASNAGGFDVRASLARITAPVLVMGGRYDVVTPVSMVQEMADQLPKSKMVVMEHSGHFPFLEENYMFTEWVRQFMTGTVDAGTDKEVHTVKAADGGSR
jgi:proline iminopeptidase